MSQKSLVSMKWAAGSTESVMWNCVLRYLWSDEILLLMRCCKGLRELLTFDIVFQSVLLRGGHSSYSRTTLDIILNLAKIGKIYMPSPMRLLRLCCGKRCERSGCSNTVNHVRQEFGVFFCWDCLIKFGTRDISICQDRDFFFHERTAKQYTKKDSKRILVWVKQKYDISHERIGPVITLDLVRRYILSKKDSSSFGVPDFLSSLETGPTVSQELLDLYDDMRQRSQQFHENRKLEAIKASEARQEKIRALFQSLRAQISSQLQEYSWAPIAMRSSLLSDLLAPFQKTPRKASKKAVHQIVQNCITRFSDVAKTGFLESGFQELLNPSDDVLRTFLRRYYIAIDGHRPEAWADIIASVDEIMLCLISGGESLHIVAVRLFVSKPDFFRTLYAEQRHYNFAELTFKEAFGCSFTSDMFRQFIGRMWTDCNFEKMGVMFAMAHRRYEELLPIAEEFLSCSWMSEFHLERLEETNFVARGGKEQMELAMTLDNLQSRSFNNMLNLAFQLLDHKDYQNSTYNDMWH